ncbi:hypothetical protein V1264_024713 [Littorina saxatilis]|uniref:P2X purinoreceptor 7 intracellular domain-containing protein n=1 Tax=Littorina saxatilis TaxID=31220 RepID=A0AAN9AL37_9CAEN
MDDFSEDQDHLTPQGAPQPYLHEPTFADYPGFRREVVRGDTDSEDDADTRSNVLYVKPDWCMCGKCSSMSNEQEDVCCCNITAVKTKMQKQSVTCITLHEGLIANCMNEWVMETAMNEHLDENGELGNDQPIHR